jgi:c-di-GMP-binding flagellar brake protein YcgR
MDWDSSFDILFPTMPPDTLASQPSERDRREYYRITVTLPICIQVETAVTEGNFTETTINLSAGGIGLVVKESFQPNTILSCTLLLSDQVRFESSVEVLRLDPVPYPPGIYRLHARFIGMTAQNRELLVRHILQFQRDHLTRHYSA